MSDEGRDAGLVAMISSILGGNKRAEAAHPPPLADFMPASPRVGPAPELEQIPEAESPKLQDASDRAVTAPKPVAPGPPLTPDGKRYVSQGSDRPTTIPAPGLPFSLVFRAEPGKEDVLLKVASAYEAASQRRVPPPNFPPL